MKVDEGLAWWVWILIVLGLGFLGLIGYRFYEMKIHSIVNNEYSEEGGGDDDDFYFD